MTAVMDRFKQWLQYAPDWLKVLGKWLFFVFLFICLMKLHSAMLSNLEHWYIVWAACLCEIIIVTVFGQYALVKIGASLPSKTIIRLFAVIGVVLHLVFLFPIQFWIAKAAEVWVYRVAGYVDPNWWRLSELGLNSLDDCNSGSEERKLEYAIFVRDRQHRGVYLGVLVFIYIPLLLACIRSRKRQVFDNDSPLTQWMGLALGVFTLMYVIMCCVFLMDLIVDGQFINIECFPIIF
ncbi:MAG TPA: hypothetical protein PKH77_22500 [Anaerolineae bacterium]|nr:hypothetical protein [Anaerolineae bacterium]